MTEMFVSQDGAFLAGFLLGGLYFYLAQRMLIIFKAYRALKADIEKFEKEGKL